MNTVINEITLKRETRKVFSCYYFGVIESLYTGIYLYLQGWETDDSGQKKSRTRLLREKRHTS